MQIPPIKSVPDRRRYESRRHFPAFWRHYIEESVELWNEPTQTYCEPSIRVIHAYIPSDEVRFKLDVLERDNRLAVNKFFEDLNRQQAEPRPTWESKDFYNRAASLAGAHAEDASIIKAANKLLDWGTIYNSDFGQKPEIWPALLQDAENVLRSIGTRVNELNIKTDVLQRTTDSNYEKLLTQRVDGLYYGKDARGEAVHAIVFAMAMRQIAEYAEAQKFRDEVRTFMESR